MENRPSGKEDKPEEQSIEKPEEKNEPSSAEAGKILLELKYHPLKKSWAVSAIVISVVILTSAMSYSIIPNILMPIFVFVFFIISMASFFMPSRYIFTEENFIIDRIVFRKSFPWTRFRSYALERNGVFISPASNPDRFDRFRGVFMVMDRESRKKLEPLLKEKLGGT